MLKLQFLDDSGKSLWLVGETLRIGTHPDNRLRLSGRGVSEFHAQIIINGEQLLLRSVAGTCFVNGLPVDADYLLRNGDELRIGTDSLRVVDPKAVFFENEKPELAIENEQPEPATAAAPGPVWRLQVDHPQLQHKSFSVRAVVRLGRADDCDVVIPYKQLAERHAELIPRPDGVWVRDLGSEKGTYINGQRISEGLARPGDKIQFARLPFTVTSIKDSDVSTVRVA